MALANVNATIRNIEIDSKTYELHEEERIATLYPAGTGDTVTSHIATAAKQNIEGADIWHAWMVRSEPAPSIGFTGHGLVSTLRALFRLHDYLDLGLPDLWAYPAFVARPHPPNEPGCARYADDEPTTAEREGVTMRYAVMGPGGSGETDDLDEARLWLRNNPDHTLYCAGAPIAADLRALARDIHFWDFNNPRFGLTSEQAEEVTRCIDIVVGRLDPQAD